MLGYVYVLINQSFPDLVKIGRTINDPVERAVQLDTTGVPTPFTVVFYRKFSNCVKAEVDIHEILEQHRSRGNREFFKISTTEAIKLIQNIDGGEDEGAKNSPTDEHFYLYLMKIKNFARIEHMARIGIFKAREDNEELYEPSKKDVAQLRLGLMDYYGQPNNDFDYFISSEICRPLEEFRGELEKFIVEKINSSTSEALKIHEDYDNQTLLKPRKVCEYEWNLEIEDLYEKIMEGVGNYAKEQKINIKFKQIKLKSKKGNF